MKINLAKTPLENLVDLVLLANPGKTLEQTQFTNESPEVLDQDVPVEITDGEGQRQTINLNTSIMFKAVLGQGYSGDVKFRYRRLGLTDQVKYPPAHITATEDCDHNDILHHFASILGLLPDELEVVECVPPTIDSEDGRESTDGYIDVAALPTSLLYQGQFRVVVKAHIDPDLIDEFTGTNLPGFEADFDSPSIDPEDPARPLDPHGSVTSITWRHSSNEEASAGNLTSNVEFEGENVDRLYLQFDLPESVTGLDALKKFYLTADSRKPFGTQDSALAAMFSQVAVASNGWSFTLAQSVIDQLIDEGEFQVHADLADQHGTVLRPAELDDLAYAELMTHTWELTTPVIPEPEGEVEEVTFALKNGDHTLDAGESLVHTVAWSGEGVQYCEIDINVANPAAGIPAREQFTLLADEANPYGDDRDGLEAMGITVQYQGSVNGGMWIVDFGPAVTEGLVQSGTVNIYSALLDVNKLNLWGDMMSPTPEQRIAINVLRAEPVLERVTNNLTQVIPYTEGVTSVLVDIDVANATQAVPVLEFALVPDADFPVNEQTQSELAASGVTVDWTEGFGWNINFGEFLTAALQRSGLVTVTTVEVVGGISSDPVSVEFVVTEDDRSGVIQFFDVGQGAVDGTQWFGLGSDFGTLIDPVDVPQVTELRWIEDEQEPGRYDVHVAATLPSFDSETQVLNVSLSDGKFTDPTNQTLLAVEGLVEVEPGVWTGELNGVHLVDFGVIYFVMSIEDREIP